MFCQISGRYGDESDAPHDWFLNKVLKCFHCQENNPQMLADDLREAECMFIPTYNVDKKNFIVFSLSVRLMEQDKR